jgi:hypothetical protein
MNKFLIITALLNIFIITSCTKANTAELTYASTNFTLMSSPQQFEGLRDCVVWIKGGAGDSITVKWKDWYAGESTINYIYFQSPDGELIEKIKIPYGEQEGSRTLMLSRGAGDYRLEIPGYFYRNAAIQIAGNAKAILEPAKYQFSIHVDENFLYFNVPSTTKSFTLCGRYYGGPESILLYDPDGELRDTLVLNTDSKDFNFDKTEITSSKSGIWKISFKGKGKVSFWLEGTENYFSPIPEVLFVPEFKTGQADFTGEGNVNTMGLIGASMVLLAEDPKVFEGIEYMGLETFNYYLNQDWREPLNAQYPDGGDNDDPYKIEWSGFHWKDERTDFYRKELGAQISMLFSESSWLDIPLTDKKRKEFAEFVLASIIHLNEQKGYNIRWFSPWDEPNLSAFTYNEYELLVKEIGSRLKSAANSFEVRHTPLLAISSSGFESTDTGADRIGLEWAKKLYVDHDNLVDGIGFDFWYVRDLVETWRFKDAVELAGNIIKQYDSDGDKEEQIVINQTSMSPSGGSSLYDVNTHFGALWIAGAVCNAFGSGQLDAFHYFTTVDDERHMKGLMYSDSPPLSLPGLPAAQPFEIKPIGHAMAMLNKTLLDEVVILSTDSIEVDALLTVDSSHTSAGLIIVNKSRRKNRVRVETGLPSEMLKHSYLINSVQFGPEMKQPAQAVEMPPMTVDDLFIFNYELEPETVYAFSLHR